MFLLLFFIDPENAKITNIAVSQIMNVLNFISKIDPDNAKITNMAVSQIMNVLNFIFYRSR